MSIGIAIIIVLLLLSTNLDNQITRNAKDIDLVVGAKGSPLQIILCNIFHIDFPTGNIPLEEANQLSKSRLIKKAIPLALGDNYQGYRIVGTDTSYAYLYQSELSDGDWWSGELEVTIGASVARELSLKVGDEFESQHGLSEGSYAHEEKPYTVVGVLQETGTVIDRLILTNIESIWATHEEDGEQDRTQITSLLVQYRSPLAAVQLPRLINTQTSMQAASPAFETARLFNLLGVGFQFIRIFALVIIGMTALSIFIALLNSLKERLYELAIIRSMGASRTKLFLLVLLEGVFLSTLGSILGVLLGHLSIEWVSKTYTDGSQFVANMILMQEIYVILAGIGVGILASLFPAIKAYRTNISLTLAQG